MNAIQIITLFWVLYFALIINLWRWSRNWYDKTGFYIPAIIGGVIMVLISCGPNIESKKKIVLLTEPKKEFFTFENTNFIVYSWDYKSWYQEVLGIGSENLEKEKAKKFYETAGVSYFGIKDSIKKIERF